MIRYLKVKDLKNAVCPWWEQVEFLKGQEKIEFGPGINVIFGPNGSGKSTILKTIARLLCCEQGDRQLVSSFHANDIHGRCKTINDVHPPLKDGVHVSHDGSPIMHFDPSKKVGLIGGSFDYDFTLKGAQNAMFKGSSGQTSLMRMNDIIKASMENDWPELKWKVREANYPHLAKFLKGTGKKHRPTVLLDEPTRSLDLSNERLFMKLVEKMVAQGVQVIMATHSVFALHLKDATYIDTSKGYSTRVRIDTELHFLSKLMAKPQRFEVMQEAVQSVGNTAK